MVQSEVIPFIHSRLDVIAGLLVQSLLLGLTAYGFLLDKYPSTIRATWL